MLRASAAVAATPARRPASTPSALSGGTGGDGGLAHADVSVPVVTTGDQSDGIVVASRGGGGGSAASATTFGVIGGNNGGRAGNGGTAELILSGAVSTQGDGEKSLSSKSLSPSARSGRLL